ncbi:unnamed protein product [Rotaria magnacalcarata]|uniref:Uncharacterized protein n=2 Tax=Rotaria magnacalcarata TaxID=392030 RepID=A0A814F1F8_9BILA|nr:unnamed protein product [Rotaria magnacalcarata]CAF4186975.1 unnamed protein product [Rotaria magnacalcarata]
MVYGKEHATEHLAKTPIAFIGTIDQVIPGISTRSMPPTNHYKLIMGNIRSLRGSVSTTEFGYHQHGAGHFLQQVIQNPDGSETLGDQPLQEQVKEPTVGISYLACSSDGQHINTLVELDNNTIEELIKLSKIPLGWSKQSNGQYESPWQHSHAKTVKWHDNKQYTSYDKCAKTGRPLLITTDDIKLTCEPVQAAHVKEYQNPDGDGVFKLTVKNNSNRPVEIPALLRDSHTKNILWEESVFVITDAGNHFFPGHGHARDVEPTLLEPNASVSTKLDTLTLHGLSWPQGGWRLHLRFCLGDKATEGSYYYFTDHHEPIRKNAQKKPSAIVN